MGEFRLYEWVEEEEAVKMSCCLYGLVGGWVGGWVGGTYHCLLHVFVGEGGKGR